MPYYTYSTIPLKLFTDIVNDGAFEKIARSKIYDIEKCYMQWEQILMTNATSNGSSKVGLTFTSFKAYIRYCTMFVRANAMLLKLQFVVDGEYIADLGAMGYKISMQDSKAYADSIKAALNKLRNVNSKIQSKQLEIEKLVEVTNIQPVVLDFGRLIAEVSASLGFQVSKNILLSEYNTYVKLIRSKK